MKIVFSALHFGLFRNFESVVRALAERGHHVHLMADEPEAVGGMALAEQLAATYPNVTWGWTPSPAAEAWYSLALKVRSAIDYVRFLAPRYTGAPKLRLRNVTRAPRIVRWLTFGPWRLLGTHRPVLAVLRWLERKSPVSDLLLDFYRRHSPDVVLLASLTVSRSFAMDQFKAARALGIPVGAAIMSWDHLSSKGLLPRGLDMALVWNDVQKREAIEMHGLGPESIAVTGAQCYDEWFTKKPTRSREEFARAVGLDPARPFVLWVCSAMSPRPTPLEPRFIKQWIGLIRVSADPLLRRAGILVRPHPERVKEWVDVSLDGVENVVIHGRSPIDAEAKDDYFESLYYSDAVIGLCTSAFLEAAIIGRPILTMVLPPYRMHQDGMVHFRYLRDVEGGILQTTDDVVTHVTQLSETLRVGASPDTHRRFVTAFIRPTGIDVPSTPRFVDAVERLGQRPRLAVESQLPAYGLGTRFVERFAAAAAREGVLKWLLRSTADEELAERYAEKEEALRVHQETKDRARERARGEKERTREARLERAHRKRQMKEEAKLSRRRAREAQQLARDRERALRAQRKQLTRRWREWRYRIATTGAVTSLKRGLRRFSQGSSSD